MVQEFIFENRESMQAALLETCLGLLEVSLDNQQQASLLVSGGSSPEPLYRQMADTDFAWENITVALVDERWVAGDHPKSNEAFVLRTLLTNNAASANFISMKNDAASAAEGVDECNQAYGKLPLPWSLCLLGMGSDGHTASLFPFAEGLDDALASEAAPACVSIMAKPSEVTGDITERMSLSLAGILKAERIVLIITGEEKRQVYQQALAGDDLAEMPVRAVLKQQKVPVDVYWAP